MKWPTQRMTGKGETDELMSECEVAYIVTKIFTHKTFHWGFRPLKLNMSCFCDDDIGCTLKTG